MYQQSKRLHKWQLKVESVLKPLSSIPLEQLLHWRKKVLSMIAVEIQMLKEHVNRLRLPVNQKKI